MRYLLLFFILSGCFFQNSNKNRIVEGNYCDKINGCEREKFPICQESLMNKKFKVVRGDKYGPIEIIDIIIRPEKIIFSNALSNSDGNIKVFETGYNIIYKKNKNGKKIEYIKLKKVWNDTFFPDDQITPKLISIEKYNHSDYCEIWISFYEKNDWKDLHNLVNFTQYFLEKK